MDQCVLLSLSCEGQALMMSRSGIYETGIVCGCLRKLERWSLSAILAEVGPGFYRGRWS